MKSIRTIASALSLIAAITIASPLQAKDKEKDKAKPYPLKTCIVSDEKLDTDPNMKSHAFVHEGQEIKLCCKSCLKDFNKDPKTYMKKLKEAKK